MFREGMFNFNEVKSRAWVKGFMGEMGELTGNYRYKYCGLGIKGNYKFKPKHNIPNLVWFDIINTVSGEKVTKHMKCLVDVQNVIKTPVLVKATDTHATNLDPIFFKGIDRVATIKYRGLDIILTSQNFDIVDITDLNGNKLKDWHEVVTTYPNDEELEKYFNSGYCNGISLPTFKIHVEVNRWLNPKIDNMLSHDITKSGINVEELVEVENIFDFDECMDYAITYESFCDIVNRPDILDTVYEAYRHLLP